MGNNLSSSQKGGRRAFLLASLASGDSAAISAVISADPDLFAYKVDKATGNNLFHAAVVVLSSYNEARPLALLVFAVSTAG